LRTSSRNRANGELDVPAITLAIAGGKLQRAAIASPKWPRTRATSSRQVASGMVGKAASLVSASIADSAAVEPKSWSRPARYASDVGVCVRAAST
jgi:hypothetical protein